MSWRIALLLIISWRKQSTGYATLFSPHTPQMTIAQRFPDSRFKVWGGKGLIYAVIAFGVVGIICQLLAQFNLLPIYR
ncbi:MULTISPECIES: hypothetical protein [unclassified Providencia]|uniref:hypothetical protein n=1 Tax=unclassified Providencia TaxID=2633465 RepID=UPI00298F6E11|nr:MULTISPECIES: hypothetical protein [unclassified Providencia]